MCELFGMSFNVAVKCNISFKGFRERAKRNPDGWGLAFYPDKSAQIFKEPIKANKSFLSKFLINYEKVQSKIFIGHVRYASIGNVVHKNTHPFNRELDGKEYVFAHNGTLHINNFFKIKRFKPIGDTDSEHIFCYLLDLINKEKIKEWDDQKFDWLADELSKINDTGCLNIIFSDGEYLFCYHDKNGYNGLCFVERKPPFGFIKLVDFDWEINLQEEKSIKQKGFIIATRELTNEDWQKFKCGELLVFKHGRMIYSNYQRFRNYSSH